jgi:UPF0176 protein
MNKNFKIDSSRLYNLVDKKILKSFYDKQNQIRKTISFYNYHSIVPDIYLRTIRDELYKEFYSMGVLGRIYIASEGINAQISLPISNWNKLVTLCLKYPFLKDINFNEAVEEKGLSFYKLIIRIRKKIVADGLSNQEINMNKLGQALNPLDFHKALDEPNTIVVDILQKQ